MIILAILLSPLAVFLSTKNPIRTFINVLLTICLWIPGVIHAIACVNEAKTGKAIKQSEKRIIDAQKRG